MTNNKTEFIEIIYSHVYLDLDLNCHDFISDKMKYLMHRMCSKDPLKRATIEEIENILDNKVKIEPIKCNNKTINCSDKIALYEQMAMDNVLYATNILGLLYDNGEDNIEVNKQKSKELYIKAAKLGLAKAQYNLGVLYKKEKDYKNAFIWFLEASKQQHQRAQYNLGIFYEDGLGTTKNLEKSKYWYKQSAINGYKLAYTHL